MNPILESPEDVLKFWFGSGDEVLKSTTEYIESRMPLWFSGKCQDFDESQRANKSLVHYVASDRVPTEWTTSDGVLARIILLDQFTRCIYRGTAHAFQYDQLTSSLIKQMIELEGYDETNKIYNCMVSYSPIQRFFIGVAAQHAEDQVMQQLGVNIAHMLAIGYDQSIEEYFRILKGYPHEHFQVVKRFGRFPSRNAVLNRESTPEEEEWLASPDCPAWAKTQLKK